MPEFRQEEFTIKLVVVYKVGEGTCWFAIFIHAEKIISFLLGKLNLDIVIQPEIKTSTVIQVPAKLVTLHRRHDTKQTGIFKKFIREILGIER